MMYQNVTSGIVYGVGGQLIHVEVEIRNGLPCFVMVGYLSKEVSEAKDRVSSALRSIGHPLPAMHITVNLSPAQIRKRGTAFDFPIAVAFLACLGLIPSDELGEFCILGELGLNGLVRGVGSCLPIVVEAQRHGIHRFFVASEDKDSLQIVQNAEIIFMDRLQDVISYFHGEFQCDGEAVKCQKDSIENFDDFSEIYGQQQLKRAVEIAVTGRHNLLVVGAPGSGKTMAMKRVPSILYPLSDEERLEVQCIYDAAGIPRNASSRNRPFRMPHCSIPKGAFLGGGREPKAGEITLAHQGVLLMDEFPEFRPECLEALKIPMEEHQMKLCRLGRDVVLPADFQLLGAMNPCPCGKGFSDGECRCSYQEKRRYFKRISGPLLDRFDMILSVPEEDSRFIEQKSESSREIRSRISKNIQRQQEFLSETKYDYFSQIQPCDMEHLCHVSNECTEIIQTAYQLKKVTKRGIHKILRLAKTIAFMDGKEEISPVHVMEAFAFRDIGFIDEVLNDG